MLLNTFSRSHSAIKQIQYSHTLDYFLISGITFGGQQTAQLHDLRFHGCYFFHEREDYCAQIWSTLSADELGRYHKQQSLVGQILAAYEQTPGDTDRSAVLMQQMQECGPPPSQIAGPMGDNAGCSIS
jgi:hypothetical protein